MMDQNPVLSQAALLSDRLERLSADSIWAHKASGMRGSLLKAVERLEKAIELNDQPDPDELASLDRLVEIGFRILEKAALEIVR